jgi:hypothetical protein
MRILFGALIVTVLPKVIRHVIPAKAGIQYLQIVMDSRLRGNDINGPNLILRQRRNAEIVRCVQILRAPADSG